MVIRISFSGWLAKVARVGAQGYRKLGPHTKGRMAEAAAYAFLLGKGYRPAPRPARMLAQTDLLLRKGSSLVLVEVKARSAESRAHLALTPAQKSRLYRQARALAGKYPQYTVRLDMVLAFPQPPFLRHIVNVVLD